MLNKQIALNIVKAQIASDYAKGIYELNTKYAVTKNYRGKDEYIIYAIKKIISKKNTGFSFYVTRDEGISSYLVYFNFTYEGKNYQISFHSYNTELKAYIKNNHQHFVKWDKASSRNNCKMLIDVFNL